MAANRPFVILLVEDEFADAALFEELLSEISPDITLHRVENGQQALDLLSHRAGGSRALRPHLIVLDLNMPVMNGIEFLREAKTRDDLRSIPVLVLTTSDSPDDVQRAYHDHASGYVVKPGTYDEYHQLLTTIESYWRGTLRLPTVEQLTP
ncbi:response regulator (plasmid) [Deinococcus sp. KNUC1210]|uniref:response regulator n=1 Tax=Deinococcus sp. KNUC1210 TaxID=2917691 RepID=UPI001EF007A8|nr:response regulator [Deinococcus sp. KNUC1210]ULH17151.1 response regulator [Deinococcus sp. KNUC1210]